MDYLSSQIADPNRPRKVVYYARVSTEQERQLYALENQMQWYNDITAHHSNWTVLRQYIDRGITGTQAYKRDSFQQMMRDAKSDNFDFIVTREVCRFARNTVDALSITRELAKHGVEVYFVDDNIWTMAGEGELRLTIMVTLAQDESRKISERVRAGQRISRENGVIYENGNILGYDFHKGDKETPITINEEQAKVVRLIFDSYESGLGLVAIVKRLHRLGIKSATGKNAWDAATVSRILQRQNYIGYTVYNQSGSSDYLEQRRIVHSKDQYIYVKGGFPPIITEEQFARCEEIRKGRHRSGKENANEIGTGLGTCCSEIVWCRKLRCSCGSKIYRYTWGKLENGERRYGFECHRHHTRMVIAQREGITPEEVCTLKSFGEWKLNLMTAEIFKLTWIDLRECVCEVIDLLKECYADENTVSNSLREIDDSIQVIHSKIDELISICGDDAISRQRYTEMSTSLLAQLSSLEQQRKQMIADSSTLDFDAMQESLLYAYQPQNGMVSDDLLELFVKQIIHMTDTRYIWILDLSAQPQAIPMQVHGRLGSGHAALYGQCSTGPWYDENGKQIAFPLEMKEEAIPEPSWNDLMDKRREIRYHKVESLIANDGEVLWTNTRKGLLPDRLL